MQRLLRAAAALALLALVALLAALPSQALAQATTLRWASQGDALTLDPHSQNEGPTNAINGQVYEKLVKRDRQLGIARLRRRRRRSGRTGRPGSCIDPGRSGSNGSPV